MVISIDNFKIDNKVLNKKTDMVEKGGKKTGGSKNNEQFFFFV